MLNNASNTNNTLVRLMIHQTKTHPTHIRAECGLGVSAFPGKFPGAGSGQSLLNKSRV